MTENWESIPLIFQNFVELRIKYYIDLYDQKVMAQFQRYNQLMSSLETSNIKKMPSKTISFHSSSQVQLSKEEIAEISIPQKITPKAGQIHQLQKRSTIAIDQPSKLNNSFATSKTSKFNQNSKTQVETPKSLTNLDKTIKQENKKKSKLDIIQSELINKPQDLLQSMKIEAGNFEDDVNLLDESYEKKQQQEERQKTQKNEKVVQFSIMQALVEDEESVVKWLNDYDDTKRISVPQNEKIKELIAQKQKELVLKITQLKPLSKEKKQSNVVTFSKVTEQSLKLMEKNLMKELLENKQPDMKIIQQLNILLKLLKVKIPNTNDPSFWDTAKEYLKHHTKDLGQIIQSIKKQSFKLTELIQIEDFFFQFPYTYNPQTYESLDIFSSAIAYFLSDFGLSMGLIGSDYEGKKDETARQDFLYRKVIQMQKKLSLLYEISSEL